MKSSQQIVLSLPRKKQPQKHRVEIPVIEKEQEGVDK